MRHGTEGHPLQSLLASARELRPKEVKRLQFDPIEAKRACNTGLTTLKKYARRVRDDFPGFEVDELLLLPELCDALKGAQRRAQTAASAAGTRDTISSAVKWRRVLLPLAESLAETGKVDARKVQTIARGTGTSSTLSRPRWFHRSLVPACRRTRTWSA